MFSEYNIDEQYCVELDGQLKLNFFNEPKYVKETHNTKNKSNASIIQHKFGSCAKLLEPLDTYDQAILGFTRQGNVIYDEGLFSMERLFFANCACSNDEKEPYLVVKYTEDEEIKRVKPFDNIFYDEAYIGKTTCGKQPVLDYDLLIEAIMRIHDFSYKDSKKVVDEYIETSEMLENYNNTKPDVIIFESIENYY